MTPRRRRRRRRRLRRRGVGALIRFRFVFVAVRIARARCIEEEEEEEVKTLEEFEYHPKVEFPPRSERGKKQNKKFKGVPTSSMQELE